MSGLFILSTITSTITEATASSKTSGLVLPQVDCYWNNIIKNMCVSLDSCFCRVN